MSITITDEMVEAAKAARMSVINQPLERAWPTILAAVAPIIEAATRERCATVAETTGEIWQWAAGKARTRRFKDFASAQAAAAEEIASDIRADRVR